MIAAGLRAVPQSRGNVYISSFPELLLVLSVFTKEIASKRIGGVDIDFINYTFCIIYFFWNITRILKAPGPPWKLFFYMIFSSLFSIFFLGLSYGGFVKQIIPIIIIYTVNFVIIEDYDWRNIFKLYVKFAYYSAIFGIIQVALSYVGIQLLIRQMGRLDSIAYEPSHYASILIPALVFTFFHFREYKRMFLTMLVALILTYNLTGYLSFLLIIGFAYINPIYIILSVPALYYLVFHVFANFNENFSMRINETLAVFRGDTKILNSTVAANGTTVSLYSNLMVAENNVKENFLTGAGLGGHDEMYYRYYKNSLFRLNWYFGINSQSAHCLTIRVLSEFGLLGFVLYITTLIRKLVFLDNGIYRSISFACLSHFLCKTFKLGGYIDYGTPFFFAMLCINYAGYKMAGTKNG
jgi:hypothetical protein